LRVPKAAGPDSIDGHLRPALEFPLADADALAYRVLTPPDCGTLEAATAASPTCPQIDLAWRHHDVSHSPRPDPALLRWRQPPQLFANRRRWHGGDQPGPDAGDARSFGRRNWRQERHVGDPALARRWAGAHGYVRHEAGSAARISRHLAADQDQRLGDRNHGAV